jgi:Tfp pilus assembly protein PilF
LASLEGRPGAPGAEDLRLKASIRGSLGQDEAAREAYQAALALEPMHLDWRNEFAELLYEQGRFRDAHQELLAILVLDPQNARARQLLDKVAQGIAEGR